MLSFKPEIISSRKEFPTNVISTHEFDVRTEIENNAAVKALVAQGGPKRLPYAFEDGVVPDGRTAVGALLELGRTEDGKNPLTIPVILLKGEYRKFSESQKEGVKVWALIQNAPDPKEGFRRIADGSDVETTIFKNQYSSDPLPLKKWVEVLSGKFPEVLVSSAYKKAKNRADTHMMQVSRNFAEKEDITTTQAVKQLGFPIRIAEMVKVAAEIKSGKPGEGISRMSSKAYVDNRQPALNKALAAVKRYADVVVAEHEKRPDKMSAKTAGAILETHVRTAQRILDAAIAAQKRGRASLLEMTPSGHRL